MTKVGNLETRTYELECVSPVHVGNGETLMAFEYLYDSTNQYVYFINEGKWITFLMRHNLIDAFADRLMNIAGSKQNTVESLWDWLVHKGISEDELKGLGERKAKATTLEVSEGGKRSLNDIHVQMATAEGQPYIPGSSIKGALRTAILFHLIKNDYESYQNYWEDIERLVHSGKNKISVFVNNYKKTISFDSIMKEMDKKAFSRMGFKKIEWNGKPKYATDEANSMMRGLHVSDGFCVEPVTETVVLQKVDATTYFERENNISLYRECIPAGTKIRFTVTIDKAFLSKIGIESFDKILEMTRDYLQHGLQFQEKVYGGRYPAELEEARNADVLLGGGTGFFSKTVFYQLATDKTGAQDLLKCYFDSKSKHNHKVNDSFITPRTLKLTRTDAGTSLMGLCKINEVSEC